MCSFTTILTTAIQRYQINDVHEQFHCTHAFSLRKCILAMRKSTKRHLISYNKKINNEKLLIRPVSPDTKA